MLPLPQGEGWGEGNENSPASPPSLSDNTPSTPTLQKSLPLSKSENEPSDPKAIIKEFKEAMDRGDERAALRAEAKYRRIDIKAEKNIYDYGPNDPDPTIDYYYEPLSKEDQAKFDEEDRGEHDKPAPDPSISKPTFTYIRAQPVDDQQRAPP